MSRYCRHGSIADMCGHEECNPPVSKTNRVVLAAEPLHEAMTHAGLIPVPVQPADPQAMSQTKVNELVSVPSSFLKAFKDLLTYAERNTCLHEETHRGGAIWEICDNCGMKWADDEGGKPANAHEWPAAIAAAQEALDGLSAITVEPDQATLGAWAHKKQDGAEYQVAIRSEWDHRDTELTTLRIRSLIADKDMITSQANLDLARGGEWRADWAQAHGQIDAEIQTLLAKIPTITKP